MYMYIHSHICVCMCVLVCASVCVLHVRTYMVTVFACMYMYTACTGK